MLCFCDTDMEEEHRGRKGKAVYEKTSQKLNVHYVHKYIHIRSINYDSKICGRLSSETKIF